MIVELTGTPAPIVTVVVPVNVFLAPPFTLYVAESASEVGRFKLSPTHNMYNFLLLDQITGQVWQVQWHIEDDKRGIIGEIKRMQ